MSGISRRSLLGYSGTAAAGAALSSAGSAQAADAEAQAVDQAQAAQAAPAFPSGTEFKGRVSLPDYSGELTITFSVAMVDAAPAHGVAPLEIANALSQLAQQRGWLPVTFYGTPAPAPLTA
ncbi:hypothetical protein [Streptomyces sp. NBC_00239]|uniref:hypothetical protein n=1 Tax=Streptomyces sp. NBC_00239 TaxID=2903640 RepID=UPI002E28A259|nr:hypothetical protein [Streptomyces sp. NBC_00239]